MQLKDEAIEKMGKLLLVYRELSTSRVGKWAMKNFKQARTDITKMYHKYYHLSQLTDLHGWQMLP